MVSFKQIVSAITVTIAVLTPTTILALEDGEYYRPEGDDVSGVPGNTKAYRRSPCPALNTLANHGYLPRDGQNITQDVLGSALQTVFNLDDTIVALLLAQVPSTAFTLDYLSTHNIIEHDASLAHTDAYFGEDPASLNSTLAYDLLDRAVDGYLGVAQLGAVRKDRLAECQANNPECTFGSTQYTLAYLESSIFILGFGSNINETVSKATAESFLVEERIPDSYETPTTITYATAISTMYKVIAAAA